jgi:hypothetical protein
MTEEVQEVKQEPKKIYTCVNCTKTSQEGFFLFNPPDKPTYWEFKGEAMCLECYIRFMVEKAIDEALKEKEVELNDDCCDS